MLDRAVLFGIISSGITLAVVLELVRRRRLREEVAHTVAVGLRE